MDAFLFKNLRFFDLGDKGFLNKLDFFKGIAKCGVVIDTHVLYLLFRTCRLSGNTIPTKTIRFNTKLSYNNCCFEKIK